MIGRWSRRALRCALALLVAGCAEGPQTVPARRCDPLASECAVGEVCAVTTEGARCRPVEAPPVDRVCVAASCPAGEACAAVEGLLDCRPVCDLVDPEAAPCPEGPVCGYRLGALDLGVCAERCAPGDDCGAGATCGLSAALPYPICVAIGPAVEGDPCADRRCAQGLACLEGGDPPTGRCTRLCDPAGAACPAGECAGRVLGVEGVGYCTEDG